MEKDGKTQAIGNYILGQTLGTGTTGKVKLAERINDRRKFAIKIIKKSFFDNKPDIQRKIRREIALMRFLDHPHLLKLEEVCESPRHLYIVMEYASNGELFDFLVTRRSISQDRAIRFFRQIVYGLDYLHSHGFCHRDLKPENILLNSANQIKIGDFGFARWMRSNVAETSCGSPHYASPEIIKGIRYDGRCADVWSAGVIFYALLSGRLPFDDQSVRNLLAKVKSGQFYMPDFEAPIQDLISKMLTVDPNQRITITQIKQHPAFRMYVPEDYIFPTPIPLPYIPDPINLSDVNVNVYKVLIQLGYNNEDDIKAELTAKTHTMAKVFYTMLMNTVSLKTLPWSSLHGVPTGSEIDQEAFIVTPHTSFGTPSFQTTDPFRRIPKMSIASPEAYSLADRTVGWTNEEVGLQTLSTAEEQDFRLDMGVEEFMTIVEHVMKQCGYDYFHPNDVQIIAKKENPETYILINAICSSETDIDVNMSRIMGTESDFAQIIDIISEELSKTLESTFEDDRF